MAKLIGKVLIVVSFFFSLSLNAQNYITHKVKEADTIEALAKKYSVTTSQIISLNPSAKQKLKKGDVLIIPNVSEVETPKVTKPNEVFSSTETSVVTDKVISEYKTHKVKRKETLFGISKLYNVTILDLKKANNFLYTNNLRKGDELKIPIFKTIVKPVVSNDDKPTSETPKTVTTDSVLPKGKYIVKKSEGVWRIAKNNNTTIAVLETLNPNLKNGVKEGDTLNVPFSKEKNPVTNIAVKDSTYTVLESEGFFRIKLKTGLDKAQLEALNPGLSETGLKPGMVLNIGKVNTTNPIYAISKETGVVDLSKNIINNSKKKIAILLPFKLSSIEVDSIEQTSKRLENDRLLNISLDFYSGVEMALDSINKLNLDIDVSVYDTNNRESNTMMLADKLASDSVNAVIGPLLPKNFNMFSSRVSSAGIPVFSPLTKSVNQGSNVYQTRPSESLLIQKITNYVKKDSTANIVVLHDSKHKDEANRLKALFPNATVLASKLDKEGKDQYFIYEVTLANTLKLGNNYVFLQTEAEGFVSNVSSVLNAKNNNSAMTITLATINMNEAFQGDNVSNYQLSNLNFTFPTMARMYHKNESKGFVENYKKAYNETPSSYAVRGFDVTMDVVFRLASSTNLLTDVNNTMLTEYTENKFMYVKNNSGGYDNHAVYLVKYNDLNIVEIED